MRDEEYLAIKDRAADRFLQITHVNAVGIGGREREGRPTGEVAIKVFVTRKMRAEEVPPDELIPASFEGLPTDVVEMSPGVRRSGEPGVTHPGGMLSDIHEFDPLRGGVSIATEGKTGLGTLGCMLRDKEDGSAIYALTNYHLVTRDGKLSRSRRVAHPSTAALEFDPAVPKGVVAEGALDAFLDAAVVRLDPGVRWIPFVEQIGFVRGSRDVTPTDVATGTFQVRKRGAKTRLTGGVVAAIGDMEIEKVRHRNTLIIRPNAPDPADDDGTTSFFSYEGDSGSVIVNGANEVVGLGYGFEDDKPSVTPRSGFGFAFRIGTILSRFRNVEGLDLEVATAKNASADDANPNDPAEVQSVPFPAGVAALSGPDQLRLGDHHYYRPLIGGAQILAEPMGAANATSLGCIVTEVADPRIAYMLTSYTGVSANGTIPPTSDTEIGQPDHEESISGCCSNIVGAFAKAAPNAATPTTAIVRMNDDQKWLAEIMRIGLVNGSETVTTSDVTTLGPLTVFKCGASSRLTSGVVVRVPGMTAPPPAGVPEDAMLIRPHPNPLKPNDEIHFSRFVDRGAVLVNRANKVVGVLYGEIDLQDANGRRVIHGLATPIAAVLDGLKTLANVEVQVASADKVDDVQIAIARVAPPHDASPSVAVESTSSLTEWASTPDLLPDVLLKSPGGLAVLDSWRRHQRELRALIDRNPRVATVWHRSSGPALLQAFIRAIRTPSATIPASVNGLPTTTCLDRLSAVFGQYGSAALRADVTRLRRQLPSISGLSFVEVIAALDDSSAAPDRR